MTHFPKRPGGRYRIEAWGTGTQNDTIIDFTNDLNEAKAAADGIALRPDVRGGRVFDQLTGELVYKKVSGNMEEKLARMRVTARVAREVRKLEGKWCLI